MQTDPVIAASLTFESVHHGADSAAGAVAHTKPGECDNFDRELNHGDGTAFGETPQQPGNKSFLHAVMLNATHNPEEPAVSWLKDDCSVESSFTYAQLWYFSGLLGEKLIDSHKMKKGDRVMIVFPFGIDFIVAFLACLRVGIVVVSVYPPNPSKLAVDIAKFAHFVSDSQARIALTTRKYASMVRYSSLGHKWPKALEWVTTDTYPQGKIPLVPRTMKYDSTSGDDELAFVQYTSGSTGNPKGVMIAHKNMHHQLQMLSALGDSNIYKCHVGWAPQYHDMGLFNILTALYNKTPAYLFSPIQFIHNPILWPQAIEKFKATWICGPNFSYALTCKRLQAQNKRFDCSTVVLAGIGAEPTQLSTINSTVLIFGIKRTALTNMYGLAETCVFATASLGGPHLDGNRVSVGSIEWSRKRGVDVTVAATNEGVEELVSACDGQVGEICVQSTSVAGGYWGKEELSRSTFKVSIAGREGHFLRTGDLGYVKEGYLFLSSRLKDVIIVNGRNVWPSDLETCAEHAFPEDIRPGCSAAFQGSEEGAVLVCEVREDSKAQQRHSLEELAEKMRGRVENESGVAVEQLVLVPRGTVPKTTSGKVARGGAARVLKEGGMRPLVHLSSDDTPRWEEASSLHALLEMCGVEDFSLTVVQNGLTSLQVMRLVNAAKSQLNMDIDYETVSTVPAGALSNLFDHAGNSQQPPPPPTLLVSTLPQNCPSPPPRSVRIFYQTLILIVQLFVVVAAAIPVVVLVEEKFEASDAWWVSRGRAGPWVILAVVLWMFSFTAICIILKWLLLGRMKDEFLPLWSRRFAAWMLIERLFILWEFAVGRYLLQTPWLNVVYLLLGARVSPTARLDDFFRCWDLVTISANATLSGALYPRTFHHFGVQMGYIKLGAQVEVESMAVVQGPATVEENVTVAAGAVVPPYSELSPPGSYWYGNLCRMRPLPSKHQTPSKNPNTPQGVTKVAEATSEGSENDIAPGMESWMQAGMDSPLRGDGEPFTPPIVSEKSTSTFADDSTKRKMSTSDADDSDNDDTYETNASDPWFVTRFAFPLFYLTVNILAYNSASGMLPTVDGLAAAWTMAAVGAAASYVCCFLLSGAQLVLFAVVLKWSFISPFLTDAMATVSLGTYFLFIQRSPALVGAWYRLLGMRIEPGACVFQTSSCPPSKAHLVSIGKNCLVFSSQLAPRSPASLLSYLSGRSPFPWSEPRNIFVGDGVGMYAASHVAKDCTLGSRAQVAAFACVEGGTAVADGAVMAGSPCFQVASVEERGEGAAGAGEARAGGVGGTTQRFAGVGVAGHIVHLMLIAAHVGFIASIVVVAVQLEKALPASKDMGGVYAGSMVRVIVVMASIFGGVMGEVLVYKKLLLGSAKAEPVSLHSWSTLLVLHGNMMWDAAVALCVAFVSGGFVYDSFLWLLGFEVEIGMVINNSICCPFQDAELIAMEADTVIDTLAYVSSHNITTTGVVRGFSRVCKGAVLHPCSGLFLSTLGCDASLLPRSKSLREVRIPEGQMWAGLPSKQAACQPVQVGVDASVVCGDEQV